jgi:hypothetical protein
MSKPKKGVVPPALAAYMKKKSNKAKSAPKKK